MGPRWDPGWPHEPCYLVRFFLFLSKLFVHKYRVIVYILYFFMQIYAIDILHTFKLITAHNVYPVIFKSCHCVPGKCPRVLKHIYNGLMLYLITLNTMTWRLLCIVMILIDHYNTIPVVLRFRVESPHFLNYLSREKLVHIINTVR